MTKLIIFGKLDLMKPKIITPSWSKAAEVKVKFFYFQNGQQGPRTETKNQLVRLLDLDENKKNIIINHDFFSRLPEWKVSLSHGPQAGIVGAVKGEFIKGLGVDIENRNRLITDRSKKFFQNEKDEKDTELLHLWTKKEAAFKALAPHMKGLKILKHLWVSKNLFGHINSEVPSGEVYTILFKDHVISCAYLKA